jgi:signal transduction histidine kinase
MKLITTTLKYNIPTIFFVLLLGSSLFYFLLKKALDHNIEEILKVRKEYVIDLINKSNDGKVAIQTFGNVYELHQESKNYKKEPDVLKDTSIYNVVHKEYLLYRELSFVHFNENKCYHASVRAPLIANHLILKMIFIGILFLCLITALVLIILNVYISRKIWSPFYSTLKNISNFNLGTTGRFNPVDTKINEFRELNNTLKSITKRLQSEHKDVKDFTTHLTHELQTPLAVINAHADLLLQTEDVKEGELKNINTIKKTVESISKFEDSLILLKRIELGEFSQTEKVDLKEKLNEKIEQMQELFRLKGISFTKKLSNSLSVLIHPQLIDSLLNNLLSNAIRHNCKGGYVEFSLIGRELQITNSKSNGHNYISETKGVNSRGLGIGLFIIKAICEKYNFRLAFQNEIQDKFCIIIMF